jgi:hypothetical protein
MYHGPNCDDEKSTPKSGEFCSNPREMYHPPERLMKGNIAETQNAFPGLMYRPWEADVGRETLL